MTDVADRALMSLLGGWLLLHEVADEWLKDLVASGQKTGDRTHFVEELAARVDEEKAELKDLLGEKLGRALGKSLPSAEELEELRFAVEDVKSRLIVTENMLDGLQRRLDELG